MDKKRYHLVITDELYEAVKQAADERGTTVIDLMRRFIKFGLVALKTSEKEGCALVIRDGKSERQIEFH